MVSFPARPPSDARAVEKGEKRRRDAGVGIGTVYRHFPSLDELVQRAARSRCRTSRSRAKATSQSCLPRSKAPRIARLVGLTFAIYERGASDLRAIRFEPDAHPLVRKAADHVELVLNALVHAALAPLGTKPHAGEVARAMIDIRTWEALRSQALAAHECTAAVSGMLAGYLKPGVSALLE